jgi:hypothetical protein
MKRIAWFGLIVAVALSARPSAQSKTPDFSGTWVQNMEKSSVQPGALQAYTNEIEQVGDNVKVVTILRRGGQETRSQRTFVIGKEEDVAGPGDIAITTRVKWEGPVLVFEALNPFQQNSDLRETWTLSSDGKVLTKVRRVPTPQGNQTQTFVLEKR